MKTLIDATLLGTLINVSDELLTLRDKIESTDNIKLIERIRKAADHVIDNSGDSFRIGNPLINQDTADTLEAVQDVILTLRTSFAAFHECSLFNPDLKRSFVGLTHILGLVSEALEFEVKKLGGEVEGADNE